MRIQYARQADVEATPSRIGTNIDLITTNSKIVEVGSEEFIRKRARELIV